MPARLAWLGLLMAALACTPPGALANDWRTRAASFGDVPAVVTLHHQSVEIDSVTVAGLHGRLTETREIGLLGRAAVDAESRLTTLDTPTFRLEDLRVEILEGSGNRRTFGADDLVWNEGGHRANGIVYLDGRTRSTVVARLHVGDRIRWTQVHRIVAAHGIPEFSFGSTHLPVFETRVELVVPAGYSTLAGFSGEREHVDTIEESQASIDGRVRRTWIARDWRPHRAEPWSPPGFDAAVRWTAQVIPRESDASVGPHTSGTWKELGRSYLQSIAWRLEPDDAVTALARTLVTGRQDEELAAAFEHVQREYRYLGLFEGRGGIEPTAPAITLERGFGDCKGLSVLLLALLRSCGIEADPVLLRTGEFGPLDPEVPSLMQMNHFIVRARTSNGRVFWLDSTTDGFVAGSIPATDAVSPVLVLTPDGGELTRIPDAAWQNGTTDVTAGYEIEHDGRLKGSWTISWSHGAAASVRALAADELELAQLLAAKSLPPTLGILDVLEASVSGWREWRDPLVVHFTARTRRPLPRAGSAWLLPVVSFRRPDLRSLDATRRTPIDLRALTSNREEITLDLRALDVDDIPVSESLSGAGASWERSVESDPGTPLILRQSLTWPERPVPAESAAELTAFVAAVTESESIYLMIRPKDDRP